MNIRRCGVNLNETAIQQHLDVKVSWCDTRQFKIKYDFNKIKVWPWLNIYEIQKSENKYKKNMTVNFPNYCIKRSGIK